MKPASNSISAEPLATKQDDKVYIYFLRGALAERQKHYEEAEVQFRKVLAIDPNNSMTLNYLGYMQADRGVKLDEALAMIQQAVKQEPQNYAYLDSLGWAYFKLGQYQLSEDNLRRAIEHNASDATVHDHLGDLYEKTGRLKLAVAQWEQSVSEYDKTIPADADPLDITKVHKKLENAWVRLAKEDALNGAAAKHPVGLPRRALKPEMKPTSPRLRRIQPAAALRPIPPERSRSASGPSACRSRGKARCPPSSASDSHSQSSDFETATCKTDNSRDNASTEELRSLPRINY